MFALFGAYQMWYGVVLRRKIRMVNRTMEGEIQIIAKFKIGLNDLIAAQSLLITKSKFHKRNKLVASIMCTIILVIIKFTIIKVDWITMAIGAAALVFAIYKFIYQQAMIGSTKRLAKDNPSLFNNEHTLTISENGLLREIKNATNYIEWNEIKLVFEDDIRYIVYISDIEAAVLKKDPLNMSVEETRKYNQLLRSYFDQYNITLE